MIITLFSDDNVDTKNIADNLINYHFIDYKLFSFKQNAEDILFKMFNREKPKDFIPNENELKFIENIRNTTPSVPEGLVNNLIENSLSSDIVVYDGKSLKEAEALYSQGNINIFILNKNSNTFIVNKDIFEVIVCDDENVVENILNKIKDR